VWQHQRLRAQHNSSWEKVLCELLLLCRLSNGSQRAILPKSRETAG